MVVPWVIGFQLALKLEALQNPHGKLVLERVMAAKPSKVPFAS